MANDKSKHEEPPPEPPSLLPWFEELDRTNSANFRGTVNSSNAVGADGIAMPHSTMPFPLFPGENMHRSSNPYAIEMPPSDLNLMTDFTPFGNSQNSMLDYGYMFENGYTPMLPSADSKFLSVEENADLGQYQALGYSVPPDNVRKAAFEVSMQRPFAYSELVTSMDSAEALNNIPQGQVPSTNIASDSERVLLPQSNILHCQIADGSSLNANPDVAAGISFVQNSNQLHVPPDMNFLEVERNWNERSAFCDLNNNFQGSPAVSGVTVGSHQARLPDSGLSRVNELPLLSLNTSTGLSPYDQSQKHHMETDTYLLSEYSAVSPPVAVTRNTSLHDQSGKPLTTNDSIDAQVSGSAIFPQESCFNPLGQEFPATEVNRTRGATEISEANSQAQTAVSTGDLSSTKVGRTPHHSRTIAGTSVKRAVEETSPATSQSQHRKIRKTQTSTSPCAKTPVPEPSSLQNLSSDASVLSLAPTSPSFICQDQSTTLIQPLTQTRSSLPPQVNSGQLLPPLPQTTLPISSRTRSKTSTSPCAKTPVPEPSSLQNLSSDASVLSLAPTSPSFICQDQSTTLIQPLTQTRSSLPPQVNRGQLLPPLPQTTLPISSRTRSKTSTSPCAKTAVPEPSSLQNLSSDASVLSLAPTSPSFICQGQSTTLIQPLTQTRSSLPPQVNSGQLLPPLPQTTLPISSRTRSKTSVPPQSQTACSFLPEAKSTTSLPLSSLTVPSLPSEEGSTTATPSLSQNARSLPPHPQTAPPLPSQKASGSTLQPKSSLGSSLPRKSQTTSPLPSNSPTSSSLPPKSQPLLPPQHQTDSHIPPNIIASPLPRPAEIASPQPRKLKAPPLPPQLQTGVHIKGKGVDRTETQTQQHIEHKCMLCKRDLAFTPAEIGRVSVPPVAPVVAVLSCGHTFHDHCLQLITPADVAKSPPCIPCAINDS